MKFKSTIVFLVFLLVSFSQGQTQLIQPTLITEQVKHDKTPPLRDMIKIPPSKSSWERGVVPNKTGMLTNFEYNGDDFAHQKNTASRTNTGTIQNFAGINNINGLFPPDTQGDVGPNHYIQMVNASFQIWDKQGNSLYGPVKNSTLWNGFGDPWDGTNNGDPIVLYDELADRWVFSQFSLPSYPNGPFYELIAVSETSDPLGAWYRYGFQFTNMPDYPKLAVWPDGYYLTVNQFRSGSLNWKGAAIAVLERSEMLEGNDADMIFYNLSSSYSSLLPSHVDGIAPPDNTPNYLMYLSGSNQVGFYSLSVDWDNTANSILAGPSTIPVTNFNSYFSEKIPQMNTTKRLEILEGRLMFPLQYRNFGTYEAMVANHTVNVGNNRAGIRWYEFRKTGSDWSLYQEGTYAPTSDSHHRWMGSIGMDGQGNIALGYSISSGSMFPSIRATGRLASDPLGEMTFDEIEIMNGTGSQTGEVEYRCRWGDYSGMAIDPSDDMTFWYSTEYLQKTSYNSWKTRIASFQLSSVLSSNIDVVSGWNLISIPLKANEMNVDTLFRNAISEAYSYNGIYNSVDEFENGKGYWLKFTNDTSYTLQGYQNTGLINLETGWNIIGPFRQTVPVAGIVSDPAGNIISDYFDYDGIYNSVTSLLPGHGYWVKADQVGTLDFSAALKNTMPDNSNSYGTLSSIIKIPFIATDGILNNKIKLFAGIDPNASDNIDLQLGEYSLPPTAPNAFDARFQLPSKEYDFAYSDYRPGGNAYNGSITHSLNYSLDPASSGLVLNFNLPSGITLNIQDPVGGSIINQDYTSGKGTFDNPLTKELKGLKLTLNYDGSQQSVEFTTFYASLSDDAVELNWQTATERNITGFEIERSEDNYSFSKIGFVQSNHSTEGMTVFSFKDESAINGKYYYRLKQVDANGNYSYSKVIETNLELPMDFELSQNYPNPFNPTTTIKFSLPVQSNVSLKIYDILGNEIKTLADGFYIAGRHRVELNSSSGDGLASGVYIYRLSVVDRYGKKFSDSKKMTLLK